jgi:hypothetical protein
MLRAKLLEVTGQNVTVSTSSYLAGLCETLTIQVITANQSSVNFAVTVSGSNDNTNFDDISGAAATITTNGSKSITVADFGHKWIRATLTRTGGSADFTVRLSGKETAE